MARLDAGLGAAGGLLVALCAVLVLAGSVPAAPPRLLRASFPASVEGGAAQEHAFAPGDAYDFHLAVASGNVTEVLLAYRFTSAQPAADPSAFELTVTSPAGQAAPPLVVANPLPRAVAGGPPLGLPGYAAQPLNQSTAVAWHPRPHGQVVALAPGEAAASAARRVAANTTSDGAGTWTLHVRLLAGGRCPDPATDPRRAAACSAEEAQGAGTTTFHLDRLAVVHYALRLEAADA